MLPNLPREMLWTDKKTMDEFFKLDPINEAFFEVFVTLHEEPFAVQTDEVKVFNEVYYQVTRMVYEHALPSDLQSYISDIKGNMGWNYSAELIMSMAYFLIALIDHKEKPLNKFFTKAINERFWGCLYWKPFKHRFERLKKERRHVKYAFCPNPYPASQFDDHYLPWNKITNNFELSSIEHILDLWDNNYDKQKMAEILIANMRFSYNTSSSSINIHLSMNYLEKFLHGNNNIWMVSEPLLPEESIETKERINLLEKENKAMQAKIDELEADNIRLKTLLENKKRMIGKDRRFTLVQIVDYCKGCVEWADVKMIVAMLNKLLRRVGTIEDSELVDSIEAEFINRRYGNTFNAPVGQVLEHVERVETNK